MNDRLRRSCGFPAFRPVFIRDRKFTFDCPSPPHGRRIGITGVSAMSTQKREPGKNYIGLMVDDDEPRAVEPTAPSDRGMQRYLLGLVAAVFNRRNGAR
jgi:hypothetical protein